MTRATLWIYALALAITLCAIPLAYEATARAVPSEHSYNLAAKSRAEHKLRGRGHRTKAGKIRDKKSYRLKKASTKQGRQSRHGKTA